MHSKSKICSKIVYLEVILFLILNVISVAVIVIRSLYVSKAFIELIDGTIYT